MQKHFLFLVYLSLVFLSFHKKTIAQSYLEKKSQHRFAQTYFGLNTQVIPSSGELVWQDQVQPFPTSIIPRFTIGGLHFWGKVDFNMNISLFNLSDQSLKSEGEVQLITGGDLSARYYPWRMKFNRLRPYFGLSGNSVALSMGNDSVGYRYRSFLTLTPLAGISFASKNWQVNLEALFLTNNKIDFYSTETNQHQFTLPRSYFSIGLVRYFDTTLREEKPKESGKTNAALAKLLAAKKLNSFSIAVAPSGAFFIKSPEFSNEQRSLPKHQGALNLDLGIGYLFDQAGWHVGLSYRSYGSKSISYSLTHVIHRRSIALEAYKFVWNYNGFVPFVGGSLSSEKWANGIFIHNEQQGETAKTTMVSPGIIFGWDIVPSPLETWTLRTNLRYYPFQKIAGANGKTQRVDQFELNFIQLVLYPQRMARFRKVKRDFYH
jgi:hypothetical protein